MVKKIVSGVVLLGAVCFFLYQSSFTVLKQTVSGAGKSIKPSFSYVDNSYTKISQVYTESFQNKIHSQIQALKTEQGYTFESPLLIANPYRTVTSGLYIYFTTSESVQIEYTISTYAFGKFSGTIYQSDGSNLSKTHESTIIGIVPGVRNNITLTQVDASGNKIRSVNFNYDAPSKIGAYDKIKTTVKTSGNLSKVSDGLYTILGEDVASDDKNGISFVAMYDKNGVLRCEIPIVSLRALRLLLYKGNMLFSISASKIVSMDKTGYVSKIYSTGQYEINHDYIMGEHNDLLFLGDDTKSTTIEDCVVALDLESGSVTELDDLRDDLKNYYENYSTLPEGQETKDWMHLNSLTLASDGKLLVSSRETSTIIAFDNIYSKNCKIEYMMGSDKFWKGTGYEDLLLKSTGKFSLHAGQHNITYVSDSSLEKGQYYLLLFNNNNTYSTTRPSYDWLSDGNYSNTGVNIKASKKTKTTYSYYYKYLVDENTKTYKLVKSIKVPYSAYVGGIEELSNGNMLINSGMNRTAYEYDKNGNLIQSISMSGGKFTYRIYKYNFRGFWLK